MRVVMILIFGCCLVLLAACGGPSPHFRGAAVTRLSVDGAVFDVRRRGTLAEAVRRNPQFAPRLGRLAGPARRAMEHATGCRVARLAGDAAMTVGRLDCGGGVPPPLPPPRVADCVAYPGPAGFGGATLFIELDCNPA